MFPLLVDSIGVAGVYALSALSWVLLYRTTRLLNLATGQLLLLGTYFFVLFSSQLGWPVLLGALVSLIAIAVIGVAIYYLMIKRLAGQSEFVIVILTLGIAALATSLTTLFWGNSDRILPTFITNHIYHWPFHSTITTYDLAVSALAVVSIGLATLFIDHLPIGLSMRAAAEHPVLASQTGIRVNRVLALGWALSLVAATLSGIAFSYVNILSPGIAESLGLLGLAPAFIGGLDSIPGALLGGVIVALFQTFGGSWWGGASQDAVAWVLMLVFLLIRPQGILGSKRVERV